MKIPAFCREILLVAVTAAVAAAAHAAQPRAGVLAPPAQTRISVQGFGRGFTQSALEAIFARAVNSAEADSGSAGHRWSFMVQTTADNRPATLVVGTLDTGAGRPVSGFYRTPSLGTTPPDVFIKEMQLFARMLIRTGSKPPFIEKEDQETFAPALFHQRAISG